MFRALTHFALACLLASAFAATASAQTADYEHEDFSGERFYVAPGPNNFIAVEGGNVGRNLVPSFGATFNYANNPFVADDLDCATLNATPTECRMAMNQATALLQHLFELQLFGSITVLERLQIGLNVPVLFYFEGERYRYINQTSMSPTPVEAAPGGSGAGLRDPRFSLKLRILDPDNRGNGVIMSASAWMNVPLGHLIWNGHFIGDQDVSFGGHFIGGFHFDAFELAINLGGAYRAEASNIRSSVGPELTWGIGASYQFHPLVGLVVEAAGATSFGLRFDSEAPTEARAAARVRIGDFMANAGAGVGLFYAVGVPVFRVFGGFSYIPVQVGDSDRDGLNDEDDACPTDPEDEDGFEDEDGCPEADNDGDQILDEVDECPDQAEDVDGIDDEDGCPDGDNDGDGVPDGYDSCPEIPEDHDGDRDDDGCPDNDTDRDGIEDAEDACPQEAEDSDGIADDDGCPETDVDGDGIPDEMDECPLRAEDRDGYRDADGCPERGHGRRRRQRG